MDKREYLSKHQPNGKRLGELMDIKDLKRELPQIPDLVSGLKKESARSYAGACPKCGGHDRFVYRIDTERFHCRKCHPQQGDIIDFYTWMYDKSISELKREYLGDI